MAALTDKPPQFHSVSPRNHLRRRIGRQAPLRQTDPRQHQYKWGAPIVPAPRITPFRRQHLVHRALSRARPQASSPRPRQPEAALRLSVGASLWTKDRKLHEIAKEFGTATAPPFRRQDRLG